DNGTLGESEFDYSYDIQKIIIQTIDKNKEGKEKTIEFAGKQYKLRYDKTVEYYLLNTTVDEYRIIKEDAEQEERCCVRLLPDDTIYTIADHPILSIDIKEGESGEKVKAKVENALKDEIDFDEYEYCRIDEPDDSAGFYYYCFVWRNVKGNIVRGDTVSVAVKYDGDITVIWMKNKVDNGYDTLPDDLSLDDYLPQIESKLKKIYGEAFVDYEVKSSFVGNIDGNLCIICDVDANYNDKQNEKTYDQIELAVFINQ
ncbi:MAG: hypothetical protein IKX58_09120, partial [Clostridia bacterium]|nr:hypothetical protein [Clostridia bacterium]